MGRKSKVYCHPTCSRAGRLSRKPGGEKHWLLGTQVPLWLGQRSGCWQALSVQLAISRWGPEPQRWKGDVLRPHGKCVAGRGHTDVPLYMVSSLRVGPGLYLGTSAQQGLMNKRMNEVVNVR